MDFQKDTKVKRQLLCPFIWAIISTSLFLISLIIDFQHEAIKEHVRFRKGFPSRTAWEDPPDGTLRCYLFNVTNTEAFLNGIDKKLHLQQIGPIVYRIKIGNTDLVDDEINSTLTFRKLRRRELVFDEENNIPGIMDQQIYIPNVVLLSIAAKLHSWGLVTNIFNYMVKDEPIFVHHTVNEILWNYTTPLIDSVRPWWPGVLDNVGTLYNAFRETEEIYTVNIGVQNGLENFFKIRTLNNLTIFGKQLNKKKLNPETCPVHVVNTFDNTLFPPYMNREDRFSIVAGDSCRTLPLVYENDIYENGLSGYKFVVGKDSKESCLNYSKEIKLPDGIFDVSNCRFVDVPSSYSKPHFFGSSYKFEEHFEGLSPNEIDHETFIWIEPKTGIPFEEKYRFQQSIPMPHNMNVYNKEIERFQGMIVPIFWYEYDLDDLPFHSALMLKATAFYMPYFQKLCIVMFLFTTVLSLTIVICRIYGINPKEALWWRWGQREMHQTISEVPTNGKFYDDSKSFLPKDDIIV